MSSNGRPKEQYDGQIDLDKILEHIGPLGRYQWAQMPVLFLVTVCTGIAVSIFAFTGYEPNYRCLIPACENISSATYYSDEILPFESSSDARFSDYVTLGIGGLRPDRNVELAGHSCQRLAIGPNAKREQTCSKYLQMVNTSDGGLFVETCPHDQLVFDRSIVHLSVTSHYGLTCEDTIINSLFNSLYMVGMLVGALLFGFISDRFGRLKALTLSIFLLGGSGFMAVFVVRRAVFATLRITAGMGGMGAYMSAYIIAAEGTLPRFKVITTMIVGLGFNIGELTLALMAYYLRDWQTLQAVAHAPMLILVGIYCIMPESTRWLIAKGKTTKAIQAVSRRASFNRADPIPLELLSGKEISNALNKKPASFHARVSAIQKKPTFSDLYTHPSIRMRCLNLCCQWFSVNMCYYGLLFAFTSLHGDPHLNFALVVFAELPSILLFYIFPNLIGRKLCLIASQLMAGLCCIIGGLLLISDDAYSVQVLLVMLGRLASSLGFLTVYLYTSELFPTSIRNTATGTCSSMARIGGFLALLMESLRNVWTPLPFIVFGLVAIFAGILAFQLPETRNDNLPETIEDALRLGQNVKRSKFGIIVEPKCDIEIVITPDT